MIKKIPISLAWSGGKDSAYSLYVLNKTSEFQVVRLHTTLVEGTKRVGLHGIQESLIHKQASLIGLPLDTIYYPESGDNQAYEKAMTGYLRQLKQEGIFHVAYGDIYLEDLKQYREAQLEKAGIQPIFPLWGRNTRQIVNKILHSGFLTAICAADADKIDKCWLGKVLNQEFLDALAPSVDPCGENGEFHTFCFGGPIFSEKISILLGETIARSYSYEDSQGEVLKKQFWFKNIKLID